MKKKLSGQLAGLFFISLFFFVSCMSDIDLLNVSKDAKIDQSLSIPVAEASMTIKEVLAKLGMPTMIDTLNNEIYLQIKDSSFYDFKPFNLADSLKPFNKVLTPITANFMFPPGFPISVPPVNDTFGLGVNSNVFNQRVDKVVLSSSKLNVQVNVSSDLSVIPASDMTVEFVFPPDKLLFSNGINPSYTPGSFGEQGQIPIGKCTIYAAGQTKIPFQIVVHIKPQSIPVSVGPGTSIDIKLSFANIELAEAWGKFKMTVNFTKKVKFPFNIEDYLPNSYLRFDEPTIDVDATSNIGADLIFKVDYLKTYNDSDPSKYYMAWFNNHTSNSVSQSIVGPTVLGETKKSIFDQFNKTNGEINQLFDSKPYPNSFDYSYSISTDPTSTRVQDFITSTNKIKFDINARIKMSLREGSNYNLSDTIKNVGQALNNALTDPNAASATNALDSATLILKISNGLPLKAIYRMTFHKSDLPNDTIAGKVITIANDSTNGNLLSKYKLNAPLTNADGTVQTGGIQTQTLKIGIGKNTIEELKQTKFIVYKLVLEGENSTINGAQTTNPIHLTTKNSFAVKMGVFIKANTTVKLGSTN